MKNLKTNFQHPFILISLIVFYSSVAFAQQQSYTYTFNTGQGFPEFCEESVEYDCVDVVFENGCGCWGGSYPGATEYLFGGIMAFYVKEPLNLWSIEIDYGDYCGGTCTFFRVFEVSGAMVYEAFGDDISNPYINVNDIPIRHYQYGSCEAAITSTTINYLFPVNCNEILDPDTDMDGIPDSADNCPGFDDSIDVDQDGIADGCDVCPGFDDSVDTDEDGISDGCDFCSGFDDNVDTDEDGIADGCDVCLGFDDNIDGDQDGIADGCDICPGFDDSVDTDQDGIADGCDICPGFDDSLDTDQDGIADGCDACPGFDDSVDSDQDGIADGCDICPGFDDSVDADQNGIADGCEASSVEETLTYTSQDFPAFCDETINYDCVDITFEQDCGCWADSFLGATEYLFGGTMTFLINVPASISSIEVEQNDYCGGTCTFFRIYDVNDVMVYEAFGDDIDNPYVNVSNTSIAYYQYGSCEAAIISTTINYSVTIDCGNISEPDTDMDGVADSMDACPGFDDNIDTDQDGIADGCDACPGFDDSVDVDQDGIVDGCDVCVPVRELNDTITTGTYSATEQIIANGEVVDNVSFEAGSSILLEINFSVNDSASFEAIIGLYENCDSLNNETLLKFHGSE